MRKSRLALVVIVVTAAMQSQTTGPQESAARLPVAVEVGLVAVKDRYAVGEPIIVRYWIENKGNAPVYVSKSLDFVHPFWGGFAIEVEAPPGAGGLARRRSAHAGRDYLQTRDIKAEIEKNYVLLSPGHFYGKEAALALTTETPGVYVVTARYYAPYILPREEEAVGELQYAVIRGEYRLPPTRIAVYRQRAKPPQS